MNPAFALQAGHVGSIPIPYFPCKLCIETRSGLDLKRIMLSQPSVLLAESLLAASLYAYFFLLGLTRHTGDRACVK